MSESVLNTATEHTPPSPSPSSAPALAPSDSPLPSFPIPPLLLTCRWCVDIRTWHPSQEEFDYAISLLQSNEQARIRKFYFQIDAKRALVGRLLILKVLSLMTGKSYRELFVQRSEYGKPYYLLDLSQWNHDPQMMKNRRNSMIDPNSLWSPSYLPSVLGSGSANSVPKFGDHTEYLVISNVVPYGLQFNVSHHGSFLFMAAEVQNIRAIDQIRHFLNTHSSEPGFTIDSWRQYFSEFPYSIDFPLPSLIGCDVCEIEFPKRETIADLLKCFEECFTPVEWKYIREPLFSAVIAASASASVGGNPMIAPFNSVSNAAAEEPLSVLHQFYSLWAHKEAIIKAMGTGLSFELLRIEFTYAAETLKKLRDRYAQLKAKYDRGEYSPPPAEEIIEENESDEAVVAEEERENMATAEKAANSAAATSEKEKNDEADASRRKLQAEQEKKRRDALNSMPSEEELLKANNEALLIARWRLEEPCEVTFLEPIPKPAPPTPRRSSVMMESQRLTRSSSVTVPFSPQNNRKSSVTSPTPFFLPENPRPFGISGFALKTDEKKTSPALPSSNPSSSMAATAANPPSNRSSISSGSGSSSVNDSPVRSGLPPPAPPRKSSVAEANPTPFFISPTYKPFGFSFSSSSASSTSSSSTQTASSSAASNPPPSAAAPKPATTSPVPSSPAPSPPATSTIPSTPPRLETLQEGVPMVKKNLTVHLDSPSHSGTRDNKFIDNPVSPSAKLVSASSSTTVSAASTAAPSPTAQSQRPSFSTNSDAFVAPSTPTTANSRGSISSNSSVASNKAPPTPTAAVPFFMQSTYKPFGFAALAPTSPPATPHKEASDSKRPSAISTAPVGNVTPAAPTTSSATSASAGSSTASSSAAPVSTPDAVSTPVTAPLSAPTSSPSLVSSASASASISMESKPVTATSDSGSSVTPAWPTPAAGPAASASSTPFFTPLSSAAPSTSTTPSISSFSTPAASPPDAFSSLKPAPSSPIPIPESSSSNANMSTPTRGSISSIAAPDISALSRSPPIVGPPAHQRHVSDASVLASPRARSSTFTSPSFNPIVPMSPTSTGITSPLPLTSPRRASQIVDRSNLESLQVSVGSRVMAFDWRSLTWKFQYYKLDQFHLAVTATGERKEQKKTPQQASLQNQAGENKDGQEGVVELLEDDPLPFVVTDGEIPEDLREFGFVSALPDKNGVRTVAPLIKMDVSRLIPPRQPGEVLPPQSPSFHARSQSSIVN